VTLSYFLNYCDWLAVIRVFERLAWDGGFWYE